MNSKEIKEALKIINEPITVNCIEYKYFNEENYNKLLEVYENCLWFANNFEQINLTIENLQKENKQLREELQQKEDIINKIREYLTSYESISEIEGLNNVKENKYLDEKSMNEMIRRYMNVHDKILEILDNKGDEK